MAQSPFSSPFPPGPRRESLASTLCEALWPPQQPCGLAHESEPLPQGDPVRPWQPLDVVAHDWVQLALAASSAAAYTCAGHALLAWEESARAWDAAAAPVRLHGRGATLACHLELVLHDLAHAWREWHTARGWLSPDPSTLLQLRPQAERADSLTEQRAFPLLTGTDQEMLHALAESAGTQQHRVQILFTQIQQEYLSCCQQSHLPLDLSFLPFPLPEVLQAPPVAERQVAP